MSNLPYSIWTVPLPLKRAAATKSEHRLYVQHAQLAMDTRIQRLVSLPIPLRLAQQRKEAADKHVVETIDCTQPATSVIGTARFPKACKCIEYHAWTEPRAALLFDATTQSAGRGGAHNACNRPPGHATPG